MTSMSSLLQAGASTSAASTSRISAQAQTNVSSSPIAESSGSQSSGPSSNPSTPLKSVRSSTGFAFPPIWSFPPFFSLQPNPSTLAHQLTLWMSLVLSWAAHDRIFVVNTDSPDDLEIFHNKTIKRRLLSPSMKQLLASMVKDGHAAAEPPKQTSTYLLYWRKPEEWGQLIYDWVMDNGLGSSIMTFYEITDGDLSDTTEFRQLPLPLLRKALDTLVKRGKAQLITGQGGIGDGARFF